MYYKVAKQVILIQILLCSVFIGKAQEPAKSFTLSGTETGKKNYEARDFIRLTPDFKYNANPTDGFVGKINKLLVFPPETGEIGQAPGYPEPGGGIVGTIPGSASVSGTGAATYTIPIEIPTGINGMQPNINIGYNSHGGNGLLGQGTNLSGLSAIVRMPNNPYYDDGNNKAIGMDGFDKLALDGQRLINTSSDYSIVNSTYTTENDPTIIVTLLGGWLRGSDAYFKVETKSGITMFYGNTNDSKVVLPNQTNPYIWCIKRMEDANGNYINYNYTIIDGETLLNTIEYTGNVSQAPFYKLKFNYISRTDSSFAYIDGSKLESKHLLDNIEILYNSNLLNKYSFAYETDIVSRLISVSLENMDGEHLNPSLLYWEEKKGTTLTHSNINCINGVVADFNNDGLGDLFAIEEESSKIYMKLYINSNGQLSPTSWNQETSLRIDKPNEYQSLDFNGDGKADIFTRSWSGSSANLRSLPVIGLSDGTKMEFLFGNTYSEDFKFAVGDFDGNGLDDVFLFFAGGAAAIIKYKNSTIEFTDLEEYGVLHSGLFDVIESFHTGDYNGDGLLDLGFVDDNGLFKAFVIHGTAILPYIMGNTLFSDPYNIETGDFNGDGITDVAEIDKNGCTINFIDALTGNKESITSTTLIPPSEYSDVLPENMQCDETIFFFDSKVTDLNSDGKLDIVYSIVKKYVTRRKDGGAFNSDDLNYIYLNSWQLIIGQDIINSDLLSDSFTQYSFSLAYIAFGKGNGKFELAENHLASSSNMQPIKLMFTDLNGDGVTDIFMKKDSQFSLISNNIGNKSYHLQKVIDGFNNFVEFDYKSLNNPNESIYTPLENANFPIKDITPPLLAVEKITHSNGVSGDVVEEYSYGGAKVHVLGKGFLGFETVNVFYPTTEIMSSTLNTLHTTYMTYSPWMTEQYHVGTNKRLNKTETHGTFAALGGKRYLYKVDYQKTEEGLNSIETRNWFTYDDYGNILTKKTTIDVYSILTTNIYGKFGAHCNNKVTSSTTTFTRGTETISRQTTFDWDVKGNLSKKTKDPGDVNELITQYLSYDEFGNAQTIEVTASGYPTRRQTFAYEAGRMIKSSTNNLLQTTTFENDLSWSNIKSTTDFKGRITSYTYDDWGRQVGARYPDGIYEIGAMRWADGNGPLGAVYYGYKETSGSAPQIIWFGKSGRKLRTETTGFNNQQVYVDTRYDSYGRVDGVSEPYYAGETAKFTEMAYDEYGRIKTKTLPTLEVITSIYSNNTVYVSGPNLKITKVSNSIGEIVSTTDGIGNESVAYAYYPDGTLKSSKPSTGPAVTMKYDTQGNRTEMIDPDAGTITSQYNGFGELLWQKDNKQNLTTTIFDTYGRMDYIERSNAPTIDYVYNTDNLLSSVSDGTHTVSYTYDKLDRISKTIENIDSKDFVFETIIDEYGRVEKEIYPSGYFITNIYDQNSILTEITDQNHTSIWKADMVNALGQFEQVTKGNDVSTIYAYDAYHRPISIKAGEIVDFTYEFDPVKANLNYRMNNLTGLREDFTYDALNRLTAAKKLGDVENYLDLTYETNGNIKSKTDAATNYIYGATKPHAVSTLEGYKNIPDRNPEDNQNITYNHFNKVNTIAENGQELNFTYGVDNFRRKTELFNVGILNKTKYYFGNYEVEKDNSNNERQIHYIAGGDGQAAVYIIEAGNTQGDLYYAYADHLGSLVALQDKNNFIHRQSFDPWGRRRNVGNWSYDTPEKIDIVDIGYTGHEHLNEFGIINMTGRLYDPVLARMLSPDPYIQAPSFAQNFNRYSYCWNNPLIYTDPSGEFIFTGLLFPIGLAPLGVIIDGACWGAAIDAGIQGLRIATGKQEQFNWAELGGAAVGGATFAGVGLIAPSFSVTSTNFKTNLPKYLGKAGWAALAGTTSTGAGMFASDMFDNGHIDYSGEDYFKTMGTAGLISGGLSFLGSLNDYNTWDKFNTNEKLDILKSKFGGDIRYNENLKNIGLYKEGNTYAELGPRALVSKGQAYYTASHELKHLDDWFKYVDGNLKIPRNRYNLKLPLGARHRPHFEIRAHKMSMRRFSTPPKIWLKKYDPIRWLYEYKGFVFSFGPGKFWNFFY